MELTEQKESSKAKTSESIRGEKEAIEKSLIFAYGSDKKKRFWSVHL